MAMRRKSGDVVFVVLVSMSRRFDSSVVLCQASKSAVSLSWSATDSFGIVMILFQPRLVHDLRTRGSFEVESSNEKLRGNALGSHASALASVSAS